MSATYWDSGAVVMALGDDALRNRLNQPDQFTRPHTLAEVFSVLTGGKLGRKYPQDEAAALLDQVRTEIAFVELTPEDMTGAMKRAKALGVRGGQVHDLMHCVAADKCGAETLVTTDRNDLKGLTRATIEVLEDPPAQAPA